MPSALATWCAYIEHARSLYRPEDWAPPSPPGVLEEVLAAEPGDNWRIFTYEDAWHESGHEAALAEDERLSDDHDVVLREWSEEACGYGGVARTWYGLRIWTGGGALAAYETKMVRC